MPPLVDPNLAQTWAELYQVKKASDPNVWAAGYVRDCSIYTAAVSDAAGIIAALGINSTHKVGVIGAAYGWLSNQIALQSGCVIAAVDTSTYIQSGKAVNADITILNADISTGSGRTAVRQALGITGQNKASFMITEDVLPTLSDAECTQLSTFLHNLSDTVVHWLTLLDQGGNQDPRLNWKNAAGWKALLPGDFFIKRSGSVLL